MDEHILTRSKDFAMEACSTVPRIVLICVLALAVTLTFTPGAEAGYGNCNGCTFHVDPSGGLMKFEGMPTIDPGPGGNPMQSYTAVLNADQNQTFSPSPGVIAGSPLTNIQVNGVLPNTRQVWITWTIQYHNIFQKVVIKTYLNPN